MATGYSPSTTTVSALADVYCKVNTSMINSIRVAMIADGGNEWGAVVRATCSYCRRERGQFPTCDGCGASEWV